MPTFSRPGKALLLLISGAVLLFLFAGIGLPGCNSSQEPTAYVKQMEEMQASPTNREGTDQPSPRHSKRNRTVAQVSRKRAE
jgi:hypothetical protein